MNLMIDPCHKWNVIYNAQSNKCHCPNSPNTAPATKNDRPKSQRNLLKTAETSFPMCGRSEHDPTMIRPWSENDPRMKPSVRNPPRNRGYFSRPPRAVCIEKYNISRSGYHSKFHRILRLPRKVTLELHQTLRLLRKVTLIIDPLHTWNVIYNAQSNNCHCPTSPNTAPATKNELLLDWAMMTWLSYYLTELWLDWAMSYDLTELLLDWAMTWLSYDLTELWLTELWAMTWLSYDYDLTELLLDWAITWLSYDDLTELLLDWATTWLSYDLTELLLDWAMTWLSYYLTEVWLDWAMTWLSYYLTELLGCDLIRISEVSHLNFLWLYTRYNMYIWIY